jgi:hypothetical protein
VGNICLNPASAHSITTVAAGNGPPLGSLTIPLSVAVVTWENKEGEQHNKRNSVNAWLFCTYFLIAVLILGLLIPVLYCYSNIEREGMDCEKDTD